jgi:hypothetical protein
VNEDSQTCCAVSAYPVKGILFGAHGTSGTGPEKVDRLRELLQGRFWKSCTASARVAFSGNAFYEQTREMAQNINRLSDEVEGLREELEARSTPPNPPPLPQAEKKPAPHQPVVLVFRDKHIQEVKNYAIVGQALWIFDEQRATKVPLSSLDVAATTKLNEQRGVEFSLPKK